ncbi:MAG: hypothetical protein PHI23_04020, partial [Candidatus Peribacteraceae bacterium]|nr:hypothetical protein [Candidatus Peribacteraceae bacterium]
SANQSGRYAISLFDRAGGAVQDSVLLDWNASTRTLSLVNEEDRWSPSLAASTESTDPSLPLANRIALSLSEEATNALEEERLTLLLQKQMSLGDTQVSDMNRELERIQRLNLFEQSPLSLNIDTLTECIYGKHPEWRPENFYAYVMQVWESYDRTYSSGDIQARLVRQKQETVNAYVRDMNDREQVVSEVFMKALEVCIGVRHGLPETSLVQSLQAAADRLQSVEALGRLQGLDIGIPDASALLDAAKQAYEQSIDFLLYAQEKETRLLASESERASNRAWQLAHGGYSNMEVLTRRATTGDGYTPEEVDASEQRRLSRAAQLVASLSASTDARAKRTVAIRDDANVQRVRQLADGTTEIALTQEEAIAIDDAFGRVAMEKGGDAAGTADALLRDRYLVAMAGELESAIERLNLGEIPAEGDTRVATVRLLPGGHAEITFSLSVPMMVNLWVDMGANHATQVGTIGGLGVPAFPNLSLWIAGNGVDYTADKQESDGGSAENSGESVSLKLTPGTYTLAVQDVTGLQGPLGTVSMPQIPVHLEMQPYRTQEIVGRISTAGRMETMPVSMRVAEFENDQRNLDFDEVSKLDPSKPVWVVIHGMNGSERMDEINELAKALHGYVTSANIQVVTINWEEAARDGLLVTQDAPWTIAVGRWTAQQLLAAGFDPPLINSAGWSHGTYAAYEMAREIQRLRPEKQINALVALDAANNIPAISGYDHSLVDFSAVSRNSLAIDSSFIAGSDSLARTADVSFMVRNAQSLDPKINHRLATTAFTEILNHERTHAGSFSRYFSLSGIMNPAESDISRYSCDAYEGIFEGVIDVGILFEQKTDGIYPRAIPMGLRIFGPGETTEVLVPFDQLA